VGRDSSVVIATRYGFDGPGIESWYRRYFPHPSRPALGPTQPPLRWVPGLSRYPLYRRHNNVSSPPVSCLSILLIPWPCISLFSHFVFGSTNFAFMCCMTSCFVSLFSCGWFNSSASFAAVFDFCIHVWFITFVGARGGVVVKALRYKPTGRGFDSRWCHWKSSVT
jgi:hypothetical protein